MPLRYWITEYTPINKINRLLNVCFNANVEGVKVLVFHNIRTSDLALFRKQIRYLYDHYTIADPDIFSSSAPRPVPNKKPTVVITFDDGFRSNALAAENILNALNIKAIFFIAPGFNDLVDRAVIKRFIAKNFFSDRLSPTDIADEMRPMSWAEIEKLVQSGHTIGAHTINHERLSEIRDPKNLAEEIVGSGKRLEARLGIKVEHFAYPFGDIDSISTAAMRLIKSQYRFCYSAIRGNNYSDTNSYALRRDPVTAAMPLSYLDFIVNNGLGCLYRGRAKRLTAMAD